MFEIIANDGETSVVFRDEQAFTPWSEYAVRSWTSDVDEARPFYSLWQLLYLNDALELPTANVPIDWLLHDGERQTIDATARDWWGRQLDAWHSLERVWRDVLLVLIRLQNHFGPAVKGTLTKSSVTMVSDPETGELVHPAVLEGEPDAQGLLFELGIGLDGLKAMYERLVWHGWQIDPLRDWHMLFRMAPHEQRARLTGVARRAQDAYDAAEIVRLFHHDLTGDLLLAPDDMFDLTDKSWKRRLFGRWPTLRYTRADLSVELRRHRLHPYEVHLAVEGETECDVCRRVLEQITRMRLDDMGVTMHSFRGVGGLRAQLPEVLKVFPRFLVLVADREGEMEREVERLKKTGTLTDETTFLWDTSFEEANFTDDELVAMMSALGARGSATLTLDAPTLRELYEEHRARVGADAQGLMTFAIGKAAQPDYGSVVVSKRELADQMAELILADLRDRGADQVCADRPIAAMLLAILRVT
jgi:hypothetical protein